MGLVGVFEGGIVLVDEHLGHDGYHEPAGVMPPKLVQQALLQDVPETALGHADQHVEGQGGHLVPGALVLDQEASDLRSVAVRDHQFVPAADEGHEDLGDVVGVSLVVLDGSGFTLLHEGMPAHGDDQDRLGYRRAHEVLPVR